jgi:hypothetical protein
MPADSLSAVKSVPECMHLRTNHACEAWEKNGRSSGLLHGVEFVLLRLAPTRPSKGSCTLNLEDEDVLYSLQQCPLNGPLNLENAAGSSICRVSLNGSLSI